MTRRSSGARAEPTNPARSGLNAVAAALVICATLLTGGLAEATLPRAAPTSHDATTTIPPEVRRALAFSARQSSLPTPPPPRLSITPALEATLPTVDLASLTSSPPLFQGLWHDPTTGLAYARNRWYDARTASWLSEDPLGPVDSPNLYAFVAWGPHLGTDPMGMGVLFGLGLDRTTVGTVIDQGKTAIAEERFRKAQEFVARVLPKLSDITSYRPSDRFGVLREVLEDDPYSAGWTHEEVVSFASRVFGSKYGDESVKVMREVSIYSEVIEWGARWLAAFPAELWAGGALGEALAGASSSSEAFALVDDAMRSRMAAQSADDIVRTYGDDVLRQGGVSPITGPSRLLTAGDGLVADHHIIPAFRGNSKPYADFIKARGIDVDEFTVTITHGKASHHLKFIHGQGKWNQRWMDWIDAHPDATALDIYQFAGQMMDEFGLSGLRIHPYGAP